MKALLAHAMPPSDESNAGPLLFFLPHPTSVNDGDDDGDNNNHRDGGGYIDR